MSGEKRRYKRVRSDFNVRLKKADPYKPVISMTTAKALNISASGVLFKQNSPAEIGSIVNVKFLKPNSFDFFEGDARVVRVEAGDNEGVYEIGIQFIGLTELDEKKLDYYLASDDEA